MAMRGLFYMGVAILIAVSASICQGALYVDEIQASWEQLGGIPWYNVGTQQLILPANTTKRTNISVVGTPAFDYKVSTSVISMTSDMMDDGASSGGKAEGEFAGAGVVMEVTGTLWNASLYSAPGDDPDNYDGVVFRGTMTFTAPDTTWTVTEDIYTHDFAGTTDFAIDSSVGLGAGIAVAGDVLKMGDFTSHFTFFNCDDVSDFHSSSISCKEPGMFIPALATVQISAVPEPATMALLAVGSCGLFLRRRKA